MTVGPPHRKTVNGGGESSLYSVTITYFFLDSTVYAASVSSWYKYILHSRGRYSRSDDSNTTTGNT